jgi:transcriptional regulator with XRE-family HTH domain
VHVVSESRNPQPALGAAIRELRLAREATQQDTAQAADITVAHLSKIERGRTNPTWGTVAAIADALGVTIVDMAQRSQRIS